MLGGVLAACCLLLLSPPAAAAAPPVAVDVRLGATVQHTLRKGFAGVTLDWWPPDGGCHNCGNRHFTLLPLRCAAAAAAAAVAAAAAGPALLHSAAVGWLVGGARLRKCPASESQVFNPRRRRLA